jgi:hypothetical protein
MGRPHFNQWLGIVEHICHPSYSGKHKWKDGIPAGQGKNVRPYLKNNQLKKGWWSGSTSTCLVEYKSLS